MRYLGPYSLKSTVEGIYRRTNNQFMPNPRIVIGDVVLRVSGEDFEARKVLFDEFTRTFTDADIVVFMDIYSSAREKDDGTITSEIK